LGFDVQARLEVFSANVTGSVITNVVVRLGDIPAVQVEAGDEQLNIYIGGTLQELALSDSPLVINSSGIISRNLTGGIRNTGDPTMMTFMSEQMIVRMDDINTLVMNFGLGGSVVVTLQTSFLEVSAALPDSFINMTSGLLGVFNNNPDDDFRDRNGFVLDLNSEQEIYEQFGLICK
jgi:hypothetical protein